MTYGLQAALKLLQDPPEASGLEGLQMDGCLVVDVCVAAWLLAPDSAAAEDPEGNTTCR